MNPYYQIPEEPRRGGRGGLVVAVVIAVVILLVLATIAVLMWPAAGVPTPGERESGQDAAGESADSWDSEGAVESAESGFVPEPGEGTEGFSSVPRPEDWRTVQYYPSDEVAAWLPAVYGGLKLIAEERWDVLEQGGAQVGLFDFKCDGMPEIVLYYLDDVDVLANASYRMDVYDVDGGFTTTYEWADFADIRLMQRARAGAVYPCTGALNESISYMFMGDPSRSYSIETMCRLDGYALYPIYQSRTEGNETTFVYGGETLEFETWNRYVNAYEQDHPGLYDTSMQMQIWDVDANIYDLAMTMVNSDQRFVMPEDEAYPLVDE